MESHKLTEISEISLNIEPTAFRFWAIHVEIHHPVSISPSENVVDTQHWTLYTQMKVGAVFYDVILLVQWLVCGIRRIICSPAQRSPESGNTHVSSLSCLGSKPV
jgi:hypothetical protein